MKTIKILAIFILLSTGICHAQRFAGDFGSPNMEAILMNTYAADKDAEAIVLYDKGTSHFERTSSGGFEVIFERIIRIKILNAAGIKYGEFSIPYYYQDGIYEKVENIKAQVYNYPDSRLKISILKPENIFTEKVNEFWMQKKFALPDVKEGSYLEVTYRVVSPYTFNLRDWKFQNEIPTLYSEYETRMIPFYEYVFILQGANKFDEYTEAVSTGISRQYAHINYQDMIYRYIMKDVPAFRNEGYISSIEDYILKLDFQLSKVHNIDASSIDIMTTWEKMIREYLKDPEFGGFINKSSKQTKSIFENTLDGKNEKEKFDIIVNYVKTNYNWNHFYTRMASKSFNQFQKEKTGDCASINLYLTGLLEGAGINAKPVFISTRGHGRIPLNYPFTNFFNYIIVKAEINGETILTDATEKYAPNNMIPPRCINDKGLIADKEAVNWIDEKTTFPSEQQNKFTFSPNENFTSMDIDYTQQTTGYYALNLRNEYQDDIEKITEHFTESFSFQKNQIITNNFGDIDKPYEISIKMTYGPEIINEKIYLSPFLNESLIENPFKLEKRNYPIDFVFPQNRSFVSEILLPDGFTFTSIPEDMTFSNNAFQINYHTELNDNKLTISANYHFLNSVYQANDYGKLKYFYNEIIKKFNDKIIIEKISTNV